MTEKTDPDLTLPSLVASLSGNYREPQLVVSIVFHPCLSRIGDTARVEPEKARGAWVLGRRSPLFRRGPEEHGHALEDPHISRQALAIERDRDGLVLRRFSSSSRCRVSGTEVRESLALERRQLLAGVSIMLGHSVVLMLRLVDCSELDAGGELTVEAPLIGRSAYMQGLRRQIAQVARSDLDVLIRGETGTGKELVAGAIHSASRRAGSPLVSVNMAAIPADLAPAALFGSARGAFTGAAKDMPGYFHQAQGGSLFLDEIGETPMSVQPQLLRALQQREVQSVGGPIRQVDLRVISATDAALEGEGCDFKAALRHRLGACEIQLLPLREHPEDVGALLLHFLRASQVESADFCLPGEDSTQPQLAAWAELFYSLLSYSWPGNVRELANFAGQLMLASGQELVVPASIVAALEADSGAIAVEEPDYSVATAPARRMRDVDQGEFDRAFAVCKFEAMPTARQLGVSRQSVYRRIEETPYYRLASQVPVAELRQVLVSNDGNVQAAAQHLRVSATRLRARVRSLDWEE